MLQSVYRITITNPGGIAAPSDGFIDNNRTQDYLTDLELPPSDFIWSLSQAKRKANLRFKQIFVQLEIMGTVQYSDQSILTPAGNYKTEPTSITFTTLIENGNASLLTWDELNPGQFLSGVPALTRAIARALTWTQTLNADVFDPTPLPTVGNINERPRFGVRIGSLNIGPIVSGAISSSLPAAQSLITVTTIV